MEHIKITISGRVQGVWFRKYTQTQAIKLGIKGFVKNLPDGSVYAEAEAEQPILNQFIAWCHVGSPLASVKEVRCEQGEVQYFSAFEIR
ncbi:MAG: acylphosphatase [Bacteroidota bacterium]